MQGIDFIGDIHGEYQHLITLLSKLSYSRTSNSWRHPEGRKICFLGDYVDRGPQILEVVQTIRGMVDAGDAYAIMGNHEFNLISWHTSLTEGSSERCRPERKRYQLEESLVQLGEYDSEWIEWMRTLPPVWRRSGAVAVHACWSPDDADTIMSEWHKAGNYWTPDLIRMAAEDGPLLGAVERVMKGPEISLPNGTTMELGQGDIRQHARIQWWTPPDTTAPMGDQIIPNLKQQTPTLTTEQGEAWPPGIKSTDPLVFCGHYWLKEEDPKPRTEKVVCLDYSVAKEGFLCAYRYDGENIARAEKMIGSR